MIFEASGRASSGANPEIAEFGDPLIACLNIVGPDWPLDFVQRLRPEPSYIRSFWSLQLWLPVCPRVLLRV